MEMTPNEREALARRCQIHDQYLYQILTGRREASAALCVLIERESENRLRRWQLRPNDWHLIWPELIGTDGSPAITEQA